MGKYKRQKTSFAPTKMKEANSDTPVDPISQRPWTVKLMHMKLSKTPRKTG